HGVRRHGLEPVEAEIVRPALEQRGADGPADRLADERQVAMIELVLQRARAGGDDGTATAVQRGDQVREGFPGTGARFDHERAAVLERAGDRGGHRALPGARLEAREPLFQRAFGAEEMLEVLHPATIPRANGANAGRYAGVRGFFEGRTGTGRRAAAVTRRGLPRAPRPGPAARSG